MSDSKPPLILRTARSSLSGRETPILFRSGPLSDPAAFQTLLRQAQKEWVVYAKPPFGGPRQVIEYLGRYTHRVAISNHRLIALKDGNVSFHYKDYRHASQQSKKKSLPAFEPAVL